MKDIKYIIADNVKLYRKKQNLTQFELAEKAELSADSIKRIEHEGQNNVVGKLHENCRCIGCPPFISLI